PDVAGKDEPAAALAHELAQTTAPASERAIRALVVDHTDLDPGREREERLAAQPLHADDLHVVVGGEEAGDVETRPDGAAHAMDVRDQDRDLGPAAAARAWQRCAATAQGCPGDRGDDPVQRH